MAESGKSILSADRESQITNSLVRILSPGNSPFEGMAAVDQLELTFSEGIGIFMHFVESPRPEIRHWAIQRLTKYHEKAANAVPVLIRRYEAIDAQSVEGQLIAQSLIAIAPKDDRVIQLLGIGSKRDHATFGSMAVTARRIPVVPDANDSICRDLSAANGNTDHRKIGEMLDKLRAHKKNLPSSAKCVAAILAEHSMVYHNRDKGDVMRLRAYAMATLGDLGVPKSAAPYVADMLSNSDSHMGYEFAAAARAASAIGPAARPLVPLLLHGLDGSFYDDQFSLERYSPVFPEEETTTIHAEVLRALAAISPVGDPRVVNILKLYATGSHPEIRRFPHLAERAAQVLASIESANHNPITRLNSSQEVVP